MENRYSFFAIVTVGGVVGFLMCQFMVGIVGSDTHLDVFERLMFLMSGGGSMCGAIIYIGGGIGETIHKGDYIWLFPRVIGTMITGWILGCMVGSLGGVALNALSLVLPATLIFLVIFALYILAFAWAGWLFVEALLDHTFLDRL